MLITKNIWIFFRYAEQQILIHEPPPYASAWTPVDVLTMKACVDDEGMGWLVSSDGCHASAITTRLLAQDKAATGDAVRHCHVKKPVRPDLAVSTSE